MDGRKLGAELIGTFWLVLGGCGAAVLAAGFPKVGIGLVGVSLAFGLTVLTGAYALGQVSGGHFNPAVSFGLWAGGRFPAKDLLPYIVAQVLGAILAAWILLQIASGTAGFAIDANAAGAFATNRFDEFSPGDHCYIDARKFSSPQALAAYLTELATNDAEYARYFEWRRRPLRPAFSALLEENETEAFCRLAALVEKQLGRPGAA